MAARQGNIWQGINAGFSAFMRGRQFRNEQEMHPLKKQQMELLNRQMQNAVGGWESPTERRTADWEAYTKRAIIITTSAQPLRSMGMLMTRGISHLPRRLAA